jgi:F0F1-type ATP synthase assembly protein I
MFIFGLIVGVVFGFVAGALVFRRNKKHGEQIISDVKEKLKIK